MRTPTITRLQLVCLPHAGASAAAYNPWRGGLPAAIEPCALDLPGHGRRIREPLCTTIAAIVEALLPDVERVARGPFALFGHSLGAIVAFELAWELERRALPPPRILFVSGTAAPSRRDRAHYARLSSDVELRAELRRLAGTPESALADAQLMELALPLLRADFAACAGYASDTRRRVSCPIQVFGGEQDSTEPAALAAWREHTTGLFFLNMLPGGHFFVHEQRPRVLELISERLELLPASRLSPQPAPSRAGGRRPARARAEGGEC